MKLRSVITASSLLKHLFILTLSVLMYVTLEWAEANSIILSALQFFLTYAIYGSVAVFL